MAPQACCVPREHLGQQMLYTFFKELAVELLGVPAQCFWAKQRLMRLEKLHGFLERRGRPRCEQDPSGSFCQVRNRAQHPRKPHVIGWDDGLQSPPRAERKYRPAGRIRLKRYNPKILLRGKDHCPTRRIVLVQLFIRAPAEELNVGASQRFEPGCQWPTANDFERPTQSIKHLDRQVDTFIGH